MIARSPDAVDAPSPPEHFIMHAITGRCVAVDAVGVRIWELLESPRSLAELTDALATEFRGDPEVIASDADAFVRRLEECGLVERRGE